jgi:small GTP-binding protein
MVNVKTCLLGDGGVGKTSIKRTFIGLPMIDEYAATLGAVFSIKPHLFHTGNKEFTIRYLIFDLAGQPRFDKIRSQYMVGAQAVLFVYDVTNRASFDHIMNWINQFKQVVTDNVPIVLIGNKIDLRQENNSGFISTEEGRKLYEHIKSKYSIKGIDNVFFIETSAKENINVEAAFNLVSQYVYDEYMKDNPYV